MAREGSVSCNSQPAVAPAARYSHVAVDIDSKLYVWGGWRKDTPRIHSGQEKTVITSIVDVLDLQDLQWAQQKTTGDPPLGVAWCAFTVVGKRIIIYGGNCQHYISNDLVCYSNSLHELDTSTTPWPTWRQLAASDQLGAPMKKWDCGLAAFTGEKFLVFGGYGEIRKSQAGAKYIKNIHNAGNYGWTNEIHCFASEWLSPEVTGETLPLIVGFSYVKATKYDVVMFGGYAIESDTVSKRINDVYILRFTQMTVHCIKVRKKDNVPWPAVRSHHSSCVLARQDQSTIIITVGGEKREWDQECKSGKTHDDVWLSEIDQTGNLTWKEVKIPEEHAQLIRLMRQRHSATACKVDDSQVIVVMHGGVDAIIRDGRDARQQNMLNDTSILEFELHETGAGKDVWLLTKAVDLVHYRKSTVVKLRKRVRELEQQQQSANGAPNLQLQNQVSCNTPETSLTSNIHPLGPNQCHPRYQHQQSWSSVGSPATSLTTISHPLSSDQCPRLPLNMENLLCCDNGNKSVRVVDELAPYWRTVGCFLRFPECDLETLSKDNQSEEDRCRRMLSMWLDGCNDENDNRPKTWETLIRVIKRARRGTLSKQIEEVVYTISDQM